MESENVKNISLFSTTNEDEQPLSDNDSTVSVNNEGALIIDMDSNNEKMNNVVEFPSQTKNDSEVIYISDHEYDSDYEYRRKTKRPGPKSKTRYKLSQDEKTKVTARYGGKKSKLDKECADNEKKNDNFLFPSIKVEIIKDPSDYFAKEEARRLARLGENISDQHGVNNKDIISVGNSNQMGKYDNKEKGTFKKIVKKKTKTNREKTLVAKNKKVKESSSTPLGTDPKADLGNSLAISLKEKKKVVKISKPTSLGADICLEADLKKSAIEERKKQK